MWRFAERMTGAPCTSLAREASLGILFAVAALSMLLPFLVKSIPVSTGRLGAPLAAAAPHAVQSSPTDPRSYQFMELPNGLGVVLVSDPQATKAAAAVTAGVGSLADPAEWPGLAHFLEHCLFLGSRDFPGENEYGAYLAEHGGGSNAFTSQDATSYFFSVDSASLEGALARFAGFFTAPLVHAPSMAREVNAVNSEHAKNLLSDGWRGWQLVKHLASPTSPLHAFSTGNGTTLDKPGVRAALLAFFSRHYTAPNMRAALVGPQSLQELGRLAASALGGIPSVPRDVAVALEQVGAGAAPPWAGETAAGLAEASAAVQRGHDAAKGAQLAPYTTYAADSPSRGAVHAYAPIGDTHDITLLWPIPGEQSAFGTRAGGASFLAEVLSSGDAGGLQSTLKRSGLVESVGASLDLETPQVALFSISLQLSPHLVELVRGAARSGGGAEAAKGLLLAALGRVMHCLLSFLDALESELITAAVEGWAGIVAAAGRKGGVEGVASAPSLDRLARLYGLSTEEAAELGSGGGAVLHRALGAQLLRNSSSGRVQEALSARAQAASQRGAYRHYYSSVPEEEGVGGTLLSWPPFVGGGKTHSGGLAARLWWESRAAGETEWLYPSSQPSEEDLAQALVAALARGLGPSDVLYPPSQRVFQPLVALRVLRYLIPNAAVGLLCTRLAEELPLGDLAIEPIYGTAFARIPLSAVLAGSAGERGEGGTSLPPIAAAAFPPPNTFFPASYELVDHGEYAGALGLPSKASRAACSEEGGGSRRSPPPMLLPQEFKDSKGLWEAAGAHGGTEVAAAALSPPPSVSLWWAPSACFSEPRLNWGVEVLPSPNVSHASPRASLLTLLLEAAAGEGVREFLEPAGRAGARAGIGFASSSGALSVKGRCFTGDDACRGFLGSVLGRLLNSGKPPPAVPLLPRLALLVQGLVNAELQAQPYTQAFAEAGFASGERRWRAEELLGAALGLVGGGAGSAGSGSSGSQKAEALGEAFAAAAAAAAVTPLLEAQLGAALAAHMDALLAGAYSVQVLLAGNVGLGDAKETLHLAVLPEVFQALLQARARAGGALPAFPEKWGVEALQATAAAAAACTRKVSTVPAPGAVVTLSRRGTNPTDKNSAAVTLLGIGEEGSESALAGEAASALLGRMLREPAFDDLRTRQALGYIASAGLRRVATRLSTAMQGRGGRTETLHPGSPLPFISAEAPPILRSLPQQRTVAIALVTVGGAGPTLSQHLAPSAVGTVASLYVMVQGVVLGAAEMSARVMEFIDKGFPTFLRGLTEDALGNTRGALARELREPPKDTGEEFSAAWGKVAGHTFDFDRGGKLAAEVETVDLGALQRAWGEIVGGRSSTTIVQVQGAAPQGSTKGTIL